MEWASFSYETGPFYSISDGDRTRLGAFVKLTAGDGSVDGTTGLEHPPELPPRVQPSRTGLDTPGFRLSSNSNFELCTAQGQTPSSHIESEPCQAVKKLLPETVTKCFEKARLSTSEVTFNVENENKGLQNCMNEAAFNNCNAEDYINIDNNMQTEPDTMAINALVVKNFKESWKGEEEVEEEEKENDIVLEEEKCSVKTYQDAVKSLKGLQQFAIQQNGSYILSVC
uniref:Uncharacterized protein n=1 Tax=Timema tahoe TaxID=61484 RepID=A0A7R9IP63_9NEOP|nr:unnamed protein product [Timema tahoe]